MKSKKLPSIVVILILTLITVIFWIMFNIYVAFTTKPESKIDDNILLPINPTLDIETLDQIEKRI